LRSAAGASRPLHIQIASILKRAADLRRRRAAGMLFADLSTISGVV
jgi:hypothetical protein